MSPSDAIDSMPCPFCNATLTAERDRDKTGRYHCQACAPKWAEARYGWLLRPKIAPKAVEIARRPMDAPVSAMANDPMFSVDALGEPVTRARTCECGAGFTQRLLSARFCEIVELAGGMRAVLRQIPDLFVPLHCPRCERRDLGRQGIIDTARSESRTRERAPELSLVGDR